MDKISINYSSCSYGWINFSVSFADKEFGVSATHWQDPFKNMMIWLERIIRGENGCVWELDQEGSAISFEASVSGNDTNLSIWYSYPREKIVEGFITTRNAVEIFYTAFRTFSESPLYIPVEWEYVTIGEKVINQLPGLSKEDVVIALANMTGEDLAEFIWATDPTYLIDYTRTVDPGEKVKKFLSLILNDKESEAEDVIKTPDYISIPDGYDSWSLENKCQWITELLDEKTDSSWDGYRLPEIHSEIIEQWLKTTRID